MSTTKIQGELEIDSRRGVIYFHTTDPDAAQARGAVTVLRICRLPNPIPAQGQLDIAHMFGCNWDQLTLQSQEQHHAERGETVAADVIRNGTVCKCCLVPFKDEAPGSERVCDLCWEKAGEVNGELD